MNVVNEALYSFWGYGSMSDSIEYKVFCDTPTVKGYIVAQYLPKETAEHVCKLHNEWLTNYTASQNVLPSGRTPYENAVIAQSIIREREQKQKPPLGLRPKFVVLHERMREVREAIIRYLENGVRVPVEWTEEYNELLAEVRARDVDNG